jgi:Mrp family chromosome partitioning ATPase
VVILSGKGGVGKSTVSSLLARSLAKNEELEIGLLDIDITGPSQPLFMGVKNEEVHKSASGWTPVYADENLAVMSAGFLLAHDAALVWGGARVCSISEIVTFHRCVEKWASQKLPKRSGVGCT